MGGEPTLHPHLNEILYELSLYNFKIVNLNTNGSLLNNNYIQAISNFNNFKIILSYHPNKCNYNFIELVDEIVKKNIPLEINVMFPPRNTKSYKIYDYLIEKYDKKTVDTKIGLILPIKYQKEEFQALQKMINMNNHHNNRSFIFIYDNFSKIYTNEEIRLFNLNKFKGMKCFVKFFTIDPKGRTNVLCSPSILKSNLIYFNTTLIKINQILKNGIICPNNECGCSIGYNFNKYGG